MAQKQFCLKVNWFTVQRVVEIIRNLWMYKMFKRRIRAAFAAYILPCLLVFSVSIASAASWDDVVAQGHGKTVYFNAWGGDAKINSYIKWAGKRLAATHDIDLVHVKLTDTAAAVSRILAEQAAGRDNDGTIDLLWVNGENFAALKRAGLLQDDSWVFALPSWQFTDVETLPALISDFAEPTEGKESPWGRAQLVFAYDSAILPNPPRSASALAEYIASHPGKFTFPQPPDFVGVSFLKQLLIELTQADAALYAPVSEADFDAITKPLWAWLETAQPNLWRAGRNYPANYPTLRRLLGDGEVAIAVSFNPADASAAVVSGELPETTRTYIHEGGTLANIHFLAIPYNAASPSAAKIVADFMLSPEAQLHKADPAIWGDPTVLSLDKLPANMQAAFDALPRGVATLSPAALDTTLAEPHPSWVPKLEAEWRRRFASGN